MRISTHCEVPGELVYSQISLLFFRTMTTNAMRLQKSLKRLCGVESRADTQACAESGRGEESKPEPNHLVEVKWIHLKPGSLISSPPKNGSSSCHRFFVNEMISLSWIQYSAGIRHSGPNTQLNAGRPVPDEGVRSVWQGRHLYKQRGNRAALIRDWHGTVTVVEVLAVIDTHGGADGGEEIGHADGVGHDLF